jgi:bacillithiol system protein YtxJ
MSLFKNIFKSTSEEEKAVALNWIPLTTLGQLDAIKELSNKETVLIFKMVLRQFEKKFVTSDKKVHLYYLDLLNYRTISDEVGYAFQVLHQSPQLLVIQNGVVVAHASHYDILELDY